MNNRKESGKNLPVLITDVSRNELYAPKKIIRGTEFYIESFPSFSHEYPRVVVLHILYQDCERKFPLEINGVIFEEGVVSDNFSYRILPLELTGICISFLTTVFQGILSGKQKDNPDDTVVFSGCREVLFVCYDVQECISSIMFLFHVGKVVFPTSYNTLDLRTVIRDQEFCNSGGRRMIGSRDSKALLGERGFEGFDAVTDLFLMLIESVRDIGDYENLIGILEDEKFPEYRLSGVEYISQPLFCNDDNPWCENRILPLYFCREREFY